MILVFLYLLYRPPPSPTRTSTRFPYTTLFRSRSSKHPPCYDRQPLHRFCRPHTPVGNDGVFKRGSAAAAASRRPCRKPPRHLDDKRLGIGDIAEIGRAHV